ncbi:MAG TPA: DUF1003 domain-containing protein [Bacteroidales bacterium]|nr:DUF1003 domain-containing protein [Bacteroidales bacterium]HPS61507.1 DUF1003 domain-containing protein [Bacteroidales bacterium]
MKTFTSDISNQTFPFSERVSARTIRHSLLDLIRSEHPAFGHESYLSQGELNDYRSRLILESLKEELGELTDAERKVVEALAGNTTISGKIDSDGQPVTRGQRLADGMAEFGGSWTFILIFIGVIVAWIILNSVWLANRAFDPFPFILLNLVLSCVAAIQAPVIMMSQNRQETKDRVRSKNDYMVNLKAEIEIRTLHEKVDHMIQDLQHEIFEMQQVQTKLLEEIRKKVTNDE